MTLQKRTGCIEDWKTESTLRLRHLGAITTATGNTFVGGEIAAVAQGKAPPTGSFHSFTNHLAHSSPNKAISHLGRSRGANPFVSWFYSRKMTMRYHSWLLRTRAKPTGWRTATEQ